MVVCFRIAVSTIVVVRRSFAGTHFVASVDIIGISGCGSVCCWSLLLIL